MGKKIHPRRIKNISKKKMTSYQKHKDFKISKKKIKH